MEQPLLRQLRETIEERKKKNPKYSLRAFARQVGIPAPTLSRLLAGRWQLSISMARKIVRGITENADEQRRMLRAFAVEPEKGAAKSTRYRYLSLSELGLLAHWGYSALLEWLRSRDGVRSEDEIARGTGLSLKEVREFLKTLEGLGFVHRSIKHGWRSKGLHLSSIRWEGEAPWKQVHGGYAERARQHLEERHAKDESIFQGITFMIAPDRVAEAKQRIREFAEEISDELSSGDNTSLYRLNIQLFPLGK